MAKRPDTAIVALTLRIREPLRRRLENAAKQRGVSLNSELAERLESSFRKEDFGKALDDRFEKQEAIQKKRYDNLVKTLREEYGDHFAPGYSGSQRSSAFGFAKKPTFERKKDTSE